MKPFANQKSKQTNNVNKTKKVKEEKEKEGEWEEGEKKWGEGKEEKEQTLSFSVFGTLCFRGRFLIGLSSRPSSLSEERLKYFTHA